MFEIITAFIIIKKNDKCLLKKNSKGPSVEPRGILKKIQQKPNYISPSSMQLQNTNRFDSQKFCYRTETLKLMIMKLKHSKYFRITLAQDSYKVYVHMHSGIRVARRQSSANARHELSAAAVPQAFPDALSVHVGRKLCLTVV